jgi:hypothetical protein
MQSNLGRVVLGIAAVVVAVVLLIVLKDDGGGDEGGGGAATIGQAGSKSGGGNPDEPSKPAIPTVAIKNGKPVGGVEELTYEAGDRIRFEVDADADDEVHIHGYDISQEIGPGRPAVFDFPATIEGVFEAELHGSGEQIAEIRVNP